MKTFNRILLVALSLVLLTACSAALTPIPPIQKGNNPYAPQPGDSNLLIDEIRIDSASLGQSQPQVALNFAYFAPTPCHQLRVEVNPPDAGNHINVKAYTVMEKDKACNLMALATPQQASLTLGTFPQGHYSVYLNDEKVGEFDS